MNRTVVITGCGVVSSLGVGQARFWSAVREGRSGIRPLEGFPEKTLRNPVAAQVPDFDPDDHFPPGDQQLLDRYAQFAVVAAREAAADASLDADLLAGAGAIIGSGGGGKGADEEGYYRLYKEGKMRAHPLAILRGMHSSAVSQVTMDLGIKGPSFSVASACSSTNHAVCQSVAMIRSGTVELMLAGGADSTFTYGMLKAWDAMRILANDTCRPFSADRSGTVLGEGAGVVVIESLEHAVRRGARIYAELAGIGMSSDAGHITEPSQEGAVRAMAAALADAGIDRSEVEYVNAHGTGTRRNDVTETRAIRQLFGDRAERLMISSTKSIHGHALGASGAMELIATVKAMNDGIVPPTMNFSTPDAECDLDYVPNEPRRATVNVAVSNAFGFGGLNAVLLLRKHR